MAGHQSRHRSRGHNEKKRKHEDQEIDGMGHTLSLLRQPELEEFNLTSTRQSSQDEAPVKSDEPEESRSSDEWQTIENGRPTKKQKKIPKITSSNYPAIKFSSDSRIQSQIKISDIQNLILYILADGPSPQFVSVKHRPEIRKVVVLMVPGLEKSMFVEEKKKEKEDKSYSPDDYYPIKLKSEDLPTGLKEFADMFEELWPVKTPGDDKFGRMHSPLHAILTAPLPKDKEERSRKNRGTRGGGAQPAREPAGWRNSRTPITEFILTAEELLENDYTLHPAAYNEEGDKVALAAHRASNGVSQEHGWVDTTVSKFDDGTVPDNEIEQGSLTAGREVLAMDCEMCMTGEGEFSLTRISIVSWDGSVVLDELVLPEKPIIDYVTRYSGITEKMLENVKTTLADIQKKLVDILHPRTILIGHSLNSDMTALKLTHPYIIDTSIIYPHPRGPPLKSGLKWLAQKYLNREIQKGHGTTGPGAGHDSIEDARTCLDLVKQKCEKGKEWGTSDSVGENIFKRVARTGVKYKNQGGSAIPSPINARSSAMIDWGDPKKGAGAAATHSIGCKSDEEVTEGVIRATNGDSDGKEIQGGGVDFIFGRLRELEALKGWWNNNKALPYTSEVVSTKTEPISESTTLSAIEPIATESSDLMATLSSLVDPNNPPVKTDSIITPSLTTTTTTTLPSFVTISPATPIPTAISTLTARIQKIYASLPPCTAFVIYSGSGDPREMSRLQAMQTQFKKEYKIKKWDQLSVKWTDVEEQALKKAVKEARNGVGFMTVK